MKQWKVVIGVLLVFVLGILAGALVTHRIYQRKIREIASSPVTVRHFMVKAMTRQLRLTPAQQVEVENTIHDSQREFQAIRKQVQPQVEDILHRAQDRIRKQLDVSQREKFDKFVEQQEKRWQNPKID
ncbi:MAG: hypothetical protein EXS18_06940 [Verrucomicrobiae bacterium]|nr:hypothetical protein [Verrucomicrobiae bacterium]